MQNPPSYVTRSETRVHTSCKEALELLRLLRKENLNAWVAFIKEDRMKPQWLNFWNLFGKTKDTDDLKVLEEFSENKYMFDWYYKENAFAPEEKQLMKILTATDPDLPSDQLMQLSVEDSALIEKWNRLKLLEEAETKVKSN